ncbi:MAG TPA: metallophosphoesterase [Candidatus Nanoarchaeia archaeon]|nr:metallophosphoesterase [Candidatus Nanoarchaeia archaeon]
MKINPDLELIDLGIWLPKEKILILSDFHLGYEEYLHQKGILLPRFQVEEIIQRLKLIFQKVKPKIIVINGDLKHDFSNNAAQEWNDVLKVLKFIQNHCQKIILIKGNHDNYLQTIAAKMKIKVVEELILKNILILHGDKIKPFPKSIKTIIIGHEHPAITLREKSKIEKFKCFLKGKWRNKELIVMPSFNPLLEGTDILKEKLLSPFLTDISNFELLAVGEKEIYNFGKIKKLITK